MKSDGSYNKPHQNSLPDWKLKKKYLIQMSCSLFWKLVFVQVCLFLKYVYINILK